MKNRLLSALIMVIITMCLTGCVSFGAGKEAALSQLFGSQKSEQESGSGTGTGTSSRSTSSSGTTGSSGASSASASATFTGEVTAGNATSASLTSSDVEAVIAHYDEIATLSESQSPEEAEAILDSFGVSGPERLRKFEMIVKCQTVMRYEAELQADPETAQILKSMGMDPIADVRAETNAADMEVVKPYYGQLYILMDED